MRNCEESIKSAVVVIGGGSAGLSAAIAAARLNRGKVILLERSNSLGGMGVQAFVNTICGLYDPPRDGSPAKVANSGIPSEFEARMRELQGQSAPSQMGKMFVLPHNPESFDHIAKEMAAETSNLKLKLGSTCTAISKNESDGFSVNYTTENGDSKKIQCVSLVDGSADAIVAEFLGSERVQEESNKLQRPAFIFGLEGVDPSLIDENFSMQFALDLVRAVQKSELPDEAFGATIRQSPRPGLCYVSVDLDSDVPWDPASSEARSEIRKIGETLANDLTRFLKAKYQGFANVAAPMLPSSIGIRESFRWAGRYVLTEADLIEGKKFSDVIAYASWPIELRESARQPHFTFFNHTGNAEIPLRCLLSRDISGVFFAGRCLSATHKALASVRVMGTCLATGQAAGMAAVLHADGIEDVDEQAKLIQQELDQPSSVIPRYFE